ncbi:MAG: hypothetical protein IKA23_03930 [Akkermansia sp.]|nr:hypothetical protein [Akkermansia sp.]
MESGRVFAEEEKAAAFVLQADETVLWAERRRPRWDRKKWGIVVIIFFLGGLEAAGLLVAGMPVTADTVAVMACLLLLLRATWVWEAHTLYLLTDKRAIIVEEPLWGRKPAAVAVPLQPQLVAECKRRANGSADYFFVEYTHGIVPSPDGFRNVRMVQALEQQLAAMGISVPQRREARGLTEVPRPTPVLAICWTLVMAWIVCYIVRDWADGRSWGTCIQVGVWAVVLLLPIPWLLLRFLHMRKQPFHIYTPGDNQ